MDRLKRCVVITSIFPPTEAVQRFADLEDWQVIVVGDRKTPTDWSYPGVRYLSPQEQERSRFALARELPWNHYCRKMIGYLEAIAEGGQVIADSDDDNIAYADWSFPEFEGEFERIPEDAGFVNVYRAFTGQPIWPRGFPLDKILSPSAATPFHELTTGQTRIGVWQALADDDPDVDAIYRLTNNRACFFEKRSPVVLGIGTLCPFNSQNTAFHQSMFPLLYLPACVTFRFTDILRGLVAQPIMWLNGRQLGFVQATVRQARNPHDYLVDFESEIPCYLHSNKTIDIVTSAISSERSIEENLTLAYEALHRAMIVPAAELIILAAWLRDLEMLASGGA